MKCPVRPCLVVLAFASAGLGPGGPALGAADLAVTQTAPATIAAGTILAYQIHVQNNGPDAASKLVLTDVLPSNTVFESLHAPAGWGCSSPPIGSGGIVTCTEPSEPAAGGPNDFAVNLLVLPSTAGGTTIQNKATIASAVADATPGNNAAATTTTVVTSAVAAVSLGDSPDPVAQGALVSYAIVVTNLGPSDAPNVVVTDTVPANTTYDHLTTIQASGCEEPQRGGTGLVRCTFPGPVPPGAVRNMTLFVRVNAATPFLTVITDSATATASAVASATATTTTTVAPSADLRLAIVDSPDPAVAGTTLTYTLTATNQGPNPASNAAIDVFQPAGTTFVSITPSAGGSCSTPQLGRSCSWTGATAAGASRSVSIVVAVNAGVPSGTTLTCSGQARSDTGDPVLADNAATASTGVTTSADVAVTVVDSPDPVNAGTFQSYAIDVVNLGPSAASGVSLTAPTGLGRTFVSVAFPAPWSCTTPQPFTNGNVVCTAPVLPPSLTPGRIGMTVKVDPDEGGAQFGHSVVVASASDPVSSNNSFQVFSTIKSSTDYAVAISDSPDPVTAGGNVTYTIVATNLGPSTSHTLVLSDTVPPGTTFVSATPSSGGSCITPGPGTSGPVDCSFNLDHLPPGGAHSVTLVVKTAAGVAGSVVSNTAAATFSEDDPVSSNNSATATTHVVAQTPERADVSVAATAAPDPVTTGSNLTYSVTARNNGPDTAQNLHVGETIPAGTTFVSVTPGPGGSCTAPAVGAGGTVLCSYPGGTPSGATRSENLVVAVGAGLADGILLSNTATAGSDTSDPEGSDNVITVTTAVRVPPRETDCSSVPPRLVVPVVLDVLSGPAHFTTQLALTNKSTANASLRLRYTAALGDRRGSGTVTDVLPAGRQLVIPDVLAYLRRSGLAIPSSQDASQQGGTLVVTFEGVDSPSNVAATARTNTPTSAPQPVGSAGLAYSGVNPCEGVRSQAFLFGLRSNAEDRSNVAVFNTSDQPVSYRVTVASGGGDGANVVIRPGETLEPYGWTQYSRILDGTGIANGVCRIERTSLAGAFGAYLVINDNLTNDGSFALPVVGNFPGDSLTLPVLVEAGSFRSELIVSNGGNSAADFALEYVESLSPALGAGGTVTLSLAAGEQRIIPNAIDFLRRNGVGVGPENGGSYSGAVRVRVSGIPVSQAFAGARTAARSGAGGQFGLFTPPVYAGQEASDEAFVFGLEADALSRSNLAVLNAGAADAGAITLELTAFDGDVIGLARGSETVTLAPGGWAQVNGFLKKYGVANGWARVRRVSGSAPWVAYGIVNDGGNSGERTGDGAFVPMSH